MTTDNKDCSGCKWYKSIHLIGYCDHWRAGWRMAHSERKLGGCGPSAKYYEPKEQQP